MRLRPNKEVLRQSALFRALEDQELDALQLCMVVRTVEGGEAIFHEGDPGTSMLLVADGMLTASVRDDTGREREINRMGVGEIVGEMAFLDPAPRSATVRAATRTMFYELGADTFTTLQAHSPPAAAAVVWAVVRDVTRRLRRIDTLVDAQLAQLAAQEEPR